MTEEELGIIERQSAVEWHQGQALIAEVRRLRAENETMRLVFADACQEAGSLGDALALARREGRTEGREAEQKQCIAAVNSLARFHEAGAKAAMAGYEQARHLEAARALREVAVTIAQHHLRPAAEDAP